MSPNFVNSLILIFLILILFLVRSRIGLYKPVGLVWDNVILYIVYTKTIMVQFQIILQCIKAKCVNNKTINSFYVGVYHL